MRDIMTPLGSKRKYANGRGRRTVWESPRYDDRISSRAQARIFGCRAKTGDRGDGRFGPKHPTDDVGTDARRRRHPAPALDLVAELARLGPERRHSLVAREVRQNFEHVTDRTGHHGGGLGRFRLRPLPSGQAPDILRCAHVMEVPSASQTKHHFCVSSRRAVTRTFCDSWPFEFRPAVNERYAAT